MHFRQSARPGSGMPWHRQRHELSAIWSADLGLPFRQTHRAVFHRHGMLPRGADRTSLSRVRSGNRRTGFLSQVGRRRK
jgi:hypothetical protein